jgi:hypothetical protein
MSRVAIVFPYFRTRAPTEMLFTPLGAACLTSQLRKLHFETRIFDCTFSSFHQLQRDLIAYQPDVVGIYSMVTLSRNTFRIAEMVRRIFNSLLIAVLPPLPRTIRRYFDAVFRASGFELSFTFADLLTQKSPPELETCHWIAMRHSSYKMMDYW